MTTDAVPSGPDKTPGTTKRGDSLEFAWTLTQQFSAPEEYQRFTTLEYWRDVRQKPNARNTMRSVLTCTMRTKDPGREALQNRVYKYARVLESFHQNDVISDEIPQRLRDGGGIDAIYVALCRDARLIQGRADGSGEPVAELPLTRTGDRTTDGAPDTRAPLQGPFADGELDDAASYFQDDNRRAADEDRRNSVPLLTATKDPPDRLRGEVRAAGASKRGQHPGAPRKVILEVEMFEFELEEVLHAKRATICANVEPPNNRGRRPLLAQLVFTSNRTEGPWPGRSTINRRQDE
jgi:hypothetical protein